MIGRIFNEGTTTWTESAAAVDLTLGLTIKYTLKRTARKSFNCWNQTQKFLLSLEPERA